MYGIDLNISDGQLRGFYILSTIIDEDKKTDNLPYF